MQEIHRDMSITWSEATDAATASIFADHLARARRGDVEGDIAANFAPDCVVLTTYGRFDGHAGARAAAALLARQLPDGAYEYLQCTVSGEIAFLEWTGAGRGAVIRDGADTFLIRDGRIRIMTIHYTVQPTDAPPAWQAAAPAPPDG